MMQKKRSGTAIGILFCLCFLCWFLRPMQPQASSDYRVIRVDRNQENKKVGGTTFSYSSFYFDSKNNYGYLYAARKGNKDEDL